MSKRSRDRMQDEAQPVDQEQLERFKAEHAGMEPLEYALSLHAREALAVAKAFPHLVKKKKPPPAG